MVYGTLATQRADHNARVAALMFSYKQISMQVERDTVQVPGPSAQALIRRAHDLDGRPTFEHVMTDVWALPAQLAYDDDCDVCRWALAGIPR